MRRTTSNVDAIRGAALELFSEGGYPGTSMRDIATAARVSAANIYNYTGSKEELLWHLIRETTDAQLDMAEKAIAGRRCPVDRLQALVAAHVRYHVQNPFRARIVSQQVQHLAPVHLRATNAARNTYQAYFASAIEEGVDAGVFRTSHARIATPAILWMGIGSNRWFNASGPDTPDSVAAVLTEFTLGLLAFDAQRHREMCLDGADHSRDLP